MSRRKSREMALQTLFQMDHNENIAAEPALQMVISEYEIVADKDKDYAKLLVEGTTRSRVEIDGMINKAAHEWKIERMPGVDRNIVRLAIYEMNFGTEPITAGVVINEAVELAKEYGTEESPRFVNGILGSLVKEMETK